MDLEIINFCNCVHALHFASVTSSAQCDNSLLDRPWAKRIVYIVFYTCTRKRDFVLSSFMDAIPALHLK